MRTRNNQINFYLSDEELKIFKKKIEKSKLNQSLYIRACLFNKPINVMDNSKEFLIELKRIGNNLNQLTRTVNQGQTDCKDEVEKLIGEVDELWQLLRSAKVEEV